MDLIDIVKDLRVLKNPNVIVGLDAFDDAGVYRLSDDLNLIQTVDFITPVIDDPYIFGRVAAANSLSDVYAMGGRPITALNLCCFPPRGIEKQFFAEILRGGVEVIQESGAVLIGGHTMNDTELKYGLSVTGICKSSELKTNSTARVGDRLILTKPIGTGVVINGAKNGRINQGVLRVACDWMGRLNATPAQAMVELNASGATDITGFGLAGHAWIMARASKAGLRFYADTIPCYPESIELLKTGFHLGLAQSNQRLVGDNIYFETSITPETVALFFDPQTSGGLLISIVPDRAQKLLDKIRAQRGNMAEIVGEVFAADRPCIEVIPHQ